MSTATVTRKKSIKDIPAAELTGKRVLVRVDFNVPMQDGQISDDTRIRAALPTITYLKENSAKIILLSHMGRPKGQVVEELRLTAVGQRLAELLDGPVQKLDDCIGDTVSSAVAAMKNSDVILLENTRFHDGDTQNDVAFSEALAGNGDLFVQDAFGVVHRAQASTTGVAERLPSVSGLLVEKELAVLSQALEHPNRPLVSIIGGAKISTKLGVLDHLLDRVDTLIIGGGMSFTLLKAQGYEIGTSLCEDSLLDTAKAFLERAKDSKTEVLLASDQVVVPEFNNDAKQQIVANDAIPADHMGVDIGPASIKQFTEIILNAKTVLWNGPLGVFELENFAKGTMAVATALTESDAFSIVGGGDSAAAIAKAGLAGKIDHISTGGGATLEYLEGKLLPGIQVLEDA